MMRSEAAKTEKEEKPSEKKRRNSLLSWVEFCFFWALGAGIGLLHRYVWGWDPLEKLLTGFREILIYAVIGVALLLIYIARRRLLKRSG